MPYIIFLIYVLNLIYQLIKEKLSFFCRNILYFIGHLYYIKTMQQLLKQYRQTLSKITTQPLHPKTKLHLLQTLIQTLKQLQTSRPSQSKYTRSNYDILSTTMSQCTSINYQNQKDIDQLQDKILKMRTIKFQNNEDIETIEEQLFEVQKIVKTRAQINDFMKKQIDCKMITIQQQKQRQESHIIKRYQKKEEKSVLNKSIDAVTNVFKGKWWG